MDLPVLDLPVLDPACIREMGEELDHAAALTFLSAYLDFLPERLDRICSAVSASDGEMAMDRVLSLKVTSAMVGAVQLSVLTESLEVVVRQGDWADAKVALESLGHAVAVARRAGAVLIDSCMRQ